MTIAAAYSLDSRPVLFADMMLTAPKRPGQVGRLSPTQPYAETVLGGIGLVSAGSVRKALIVNDRLAVAWCGDLSSATRVITRLRLIFGQASASLQSLREELSFLDEIPLEAFCKVVGWLVDDSRTCFRWDSRSPSKLETGLEFVEGSGASLFLAMVNEPRVRGGSEQSTPQERVEFMLAARIAASLRRDWGDSATTLNGFGYWYEAILLDDEGRFRYVDGLLFSAWMVDFDLGGKVILVAPPSIIVQARSYERFAVVQTTWIDHRGRATETYVDVVGDRTDPLDDINPRKQRIRTEADNLCWAFIVSVGSRRGEVILVTERGASFGRFVMEGRSRIEFRPEELFEIFQSAIIETPPA